VDSGLEWPTDKSGEDILASKGHVKNARLFVGDKDSRTTSKRGKMGGKGRQNKTVTTGVGKLRPANELNRGVEPRGPVRAYRKSKLGKEGSGRGLVRNVRRPWAPKEWGKAGEEIYGER